jgi:hypothetical protein
MQIGKNHGFLNKNNRLVAWKILLEIKDDNRTNGSEKIMSKK